MGISWWDIKYLWDLKSLDRFYPEVGQGYQNTSLIISTFFMKLEKENLTVGLRTWYVEGQKSWSPTSKHQLVSVICLSQSILSTAQLKLQQKFIFTIKITYTFINSDFLWQKRSPYQQNFPLIGHTIFN